MARRGEQQRGERTRFLEPDQPAVQSRGREAGAAGAGGSSSRRRPASVPQQEPLRKSWYHPTLGKVVFIALALAFVVFAAQLCSSASSIRVTVNGSQYELRGEKTLQVALKESGLPINPGDLISLEGNVIKRSAGDPFFATVNDEETVDPGYKLRDGDVITIVDGNDKLEPYDAVENPVPFSASIVGVGPIHTFTPGSDGVVETRTGQISGEVVDKQTVDPVDLIETRSEPAVGDRKVVALTFDGGPSVAYTEDILDILEANDAKATFFCRGDAITGEGVDIVKRAAAEGHQICTHSYDDAELMNGEMSLLTTEQLTDEVKLGLQAIADALSTEEEPYEPSRIARIGVKDLDERSLITVAPLIDAEIGWTLDTGDWVYMSEDDIYGVLMSISPGDVVRMHDGGAQQDATVAALKRALPKLVKKGYEFVTVGELMGDNADDESDQ